MVVEGDGRSAVHGPMKPKKKYCPECERWLKVEKFGKNAAQHDGLYGVCKVCKRVRSLAKQHGISKAEVRKWIKQKRCSVCLNKERRLVLDHNHETGRIRGVLCHQCNSALGLLGDDLVWVSALCSYVINTDPEQTQRLKEVQEALLSLFAMIDAVFTEDDALSKAKRRMSLGRCYEEWKRCRKVLDRKFDPERHDRMIKFGAMPMSGGLRRGVKD